MKDLYELYSQGKLYHRDASPHTTTLKNKFKSYCLYIPLFNKLFHNNAKVYNNEIIAQAVMRLIHKFLDKAQQYISPDGSVVILYHCVLLLHSQLFYASRAIDHS